MGKTSIILRFTKNVFNEEFMSSIGVDFKSKDIYIDGKKIKLQIWDTAGQERFKTITASYYRGAHAIGVVFDLTKKESFEHVVKWMADINRFAKENVLKFIIGNKSDLADQRQVKHEEVRALASQMNTTFFYVSAKNDYNIKEFFESATKIYINKYNFFEEDEQKVVINKKIVKNDNKKKEKKKFDNCVIF